MSENILTEEELELAKDICEFYAVFHSNRNRTDAVEIIWPKILKLSDLAKEAKKEC